MNINFFTLGSIHGRFNRFNLKNMLRTIFYLLPPGVRLFIRKVVYFPADLIQGRSGELRPPRRLIYTGGGDFRLIGEQWVAFFEEYAGLNEENNVLDIGSGIGRIAIPMTRFLRGRYEGFDAVKQGVDWCRKHISKRFPNFRFTYVDLFNDLYKSKGVNAANFVFPYKEEEFDLACSISVFTHMLPEEVENYLRETHRVLKNRGYLVASFFILDEDSRRRMAEYDGLDFRHSYGHYALLDKKVKSANVAFDRGYLLEAVERAGFVLERETAGHWCGREKVQAMRFQDILVLRKVAV
jgi:SAM-dependent methyltransferase